MIPNKQIANKIRFLKTASRLVLIVLSLTTQAQEATIAVHLNTKRMVNGIDYFDRQKYITIHADITNDWGGDNLLADARKDFLEGYDVYLGRETGGLKGALNSVKQDPNRPGFADESDIQSLGVKTRRAYKAATDLHYYENRQKNMVIGAQYHPFWPDGTKTKKGWALSQTNTKEEPLGTATGHFMAHYIKEFYGNDKPKPKYVEVINEPLWELIPTKENGNAVKENAAVQKMALFHSTVAREIKKVNPDVLVGGYTCAFPDFELYDFKRWEYRWKQFIDLTANDMDFWSLHFYDFPCKQDYNNGKLNYVKKYRKGSNLEASLDMLEQYSMMKFGKIKPMVISEYSVQAHQYRDLAWTPWRDYLYVKSANSMLMTFMDHPQSIGMAIPFFMLKSEWGRTPEGHPYRSRLFRQQFEKEGEVGNKWVYTDLVKFYQLWSDVKGKRIDVKSSLIDIQTDGYIDGKKAYVILNNLTETKVPLKLNVFALENNSLNSIKVKQFYSPYKEVEIKREGIIEEKVVNTNIETIDLEPEGTIVLEYTYKKPIKINTLKKEVKYYAEENYQAIAANKAIVFHFKNIELATQVEAVLRLGIARDHGQALKPMVQINGKNIDVTDNFAGDMQTHKERFYGVLEIPIDPKLLQTNNEIQIKFSESGGHIASSTMRVFNYNTEK